MSLPGGAVVVEDAALEVRAGQVISLLGPSGAGKTTVLRAIFSPEKVTEGGFRVQWSEREFRPSLPSSRSGERFSITSTLPRTSLLPRREAGFVASRRRGSVRSISTKNSLSRAEALLFSATVGLSE